MSVQTITTNPSAKIAALRMSDRLHEMSGEVRVLAYAAAGIGRDDDEDGGSLCNMLLRLAEKIHDIGDEVHENGKS